MTTAPIPGVRDRSTANQISMDFTMGVAQDMAKTASMTPTTTKGGKAPENRVGRPRTGIPEVSPLLRIGSPRCQCGICGLVFSSPTPFDMHQRLSPEGDAICLTEDEMRAKGMVQNDQGIWLSKAGSWKPGDV